MPHRKAQPARTPAARDRKIVESVAAALVGAGWMVEHAPWSARESGGDLIAERGQYRVVIEVKFIAEGRADRLIPLWSQAWLQAQHAAELAGHHPVAIVAADRISDKAAAAVLAFIKTFAPRAAGGVMDLAGAIHLVGAELQDLNASPPRLPRTPRAPQPVERRGLRFSDINQWLLKVLLAPRIPTEMLSAPRERYVGATDLAAAAGVSIMSASRIIRDLAREGYLDEGAPHLQLVRVRDLLNRWQAAVHAEPVLEQAWRALVPAQAPIALERWMQQGDACWALFAAAQQHWFGFVEGVPPYAYALDERAWQRLANAGFVPARAYDTPDVIVRRSRAPASVRRGMLAPGGRPACDIIQVWLDVSGHPSRGAEQAALIWRKVFEPICEAPVA